MISVPFPAAVRWLRRLLPAICSVMFIVFVIGSNRQPQNNGRVLRGILNPELHKKSTCQLSDLNVVRILLVLRVHVTHITARQYVREKIENSTGCNVQILFIYGKLSGNHAVDYQRIISAERDKYGDILQLNDVKDAQLKGLRCVDAVKPFLTRARDSCTFHQQVAFGSFQMAATSKETMYDRLKKKNESWVDRCLQFTVSKDTNIQFFAHYFPPAQPADFKKTIHQKLNQTTLFTRQDTVVSPHNYQQLIAPAEETLCGSNKPLTAIIAVHSNPTNFVNREMIRSTWGNKNDLTQLGIAVIFLLGRKEDFSKRDIAQLAEESDLHRDIVQADFLDSYKNMTLKQVMLLKFLSGLCSNAPFQYVLKTDDDMVLDLHAVWGYIQRISSPNTVNAIHCLHMNEVAYVLRSDVPESNKKWHVSVNDYPDGLYPAYCAGAGYLLTRTLVKKIYEASLHVRSFWVDDTFLSGMLAQVVGDVTLFQIPKQTLYPLQDLVKKHDIGRQMGVHVAREMLLFTIYWNRLQAASRLEKQSHFERV